MPGIAGIGGLIYFSDFGEGPTEPAWSGAPGFIGNGSFTQVNGDVAFSVSYPSSIAFNDILLLSVITYEATSGTPTINTPAGWTLIDEGTIAATSGLRFGTYWKRATGTESGSVTVTAANANSANDVKSGIMCNYRGCLSTGTPYEALATNMANSTNPTGSSVTTTGSDRKVVNLIAKTQTNANADCAPAAGWTEEYEGGSNATRITGHALHDKTVASASTEPAEGATNASCRWKVVSFALRPR